MKKLILVSFLFITSSLFSQTWQQNNVTIKIDKLETAPLTIPGSAFFCLEIVNNSKNAINISPSIISNPVIDYNTAFSKLGYRFKIGALVVGVGSAYVLFKYGDKKSLWPLFPIPLALGLAYKLLNTMFHFNVLHNPFIVKPYSATKKYFWLKNPKDQIKIDWDAVKTPK